MLQTRRHRSRRLARLLRRQSRANAHRRVLGPFPVLAARAQQSVQRVLDLSFSIDEVQARPQSKSVSLRLRITARDGSSPAQVQRIVLNAALRVDPARRNDYDPEN